MNYQEQFNKSPLTYTDIAHALGVCELTARNKISGKTKITKAEQLLLNDLFNKEGDKSCEQQN